MGPIWSCHSTIGDDFGYFGPCFRETNKAFLDDPILLALDAGIFPARVPVPGKGEVLIRHPIHRLVGQREDDAVRQLWGRVMAHLLGHSLGLEAEADVRNVPAPAGRHQQPDRAPLTPLAPDAYARWDGLSLAPAGDGTPVVEAYPNYDELARTNDDLSNPDNDGKLEHLDNCPGVFNDQSNSDDGPWDTRYLFPDNVEEFGDACDPDTDGDGLPNPAPGVGESRPPHPRRRAPR